MQGQTEETSYLSANLTSQKDSNSFYADKLSDLRRKIQNIQTKHEMTIQEQPTSMTVVLDQSPARSRHQDSA